MVTEQIRASSEAIFAFVISDAVNKVWDEWMEGRWIFQGAVKLGSVARFHTRGLLRSFGELTGEVTEFEINKKITICNKDATGRTVVTDTLILDPVADGTSATYLTDFALPYSEFAMLVDRALLNEEMEKMHVAMLENLKRALER